MTRQFHCEYLPQGSKKRVTLSFTALTAAFCTTADRRGPLECPLTEECANTCTGEYYTAGKKFPSHATTQMNLEDILVNDTSQSQKDE